MRKKSLLFVLFISILLVSCVQNTDCSTYDNQYLTHGFDEESGQCVVVRSLQQNVCGNGIVESDETYCTCEQDVDKEHPTLGCHGSKGEYLSKVCTVSNECELQQNDKVVEQTLSVKFETGDLVFNAEFTYNKPYILNTIDDNEVLVELNYFKPRFDTYEIADLRVSKMIIENTASIKHDEIEYDRDIPNPDFDLPKKTFELSQTSQYKTLETLRANLFVTYTKNTYDSVGTLVRSEEKIETIPGVVGQWEIINPNFFEE